ncbi:MAG: GEVED domain-containing protein, partial [Ferruginibacter sp.]
MQILRSIVFCHILLLLSVKANSQKIVFTEGFEAGFPPPDWSVQNYSTSGNGWGQYSWDKNSGVYAAACFPNVASANTWLFTRPVDLLAGKYYVLSYYFETQTSASLKVTIGNYPDYQSQKKIIHNTFTSSGSFELINDTIVCEQTGTYYIGFNNYSSSSSSCGSLIDDVSFTELNLPSCSTVSAGTVSSGVSSICANTQFTITNTNATTNTFGIRYAWQKSTDAVNWTNITDGYFYQPAIQVIQNVATYYRLTDTCISSGVSSISNRILVSNSSYLSCYCTPSYVNCYNNLFFTNVSIINSLTNNSTACSTNGYGDFTSVGNANVYRNQNIYIQHTVINPNNYQYTVGVWADVNHNGLFEENEFSVNGPFSSLVATSQFLVPVNALTGETRLRLKLRYYSSYEPVLIDYSETCTANAQSGETEDYKITIGDVTNCTGSVSAGTLSAVSQICPNNNFNIAASNTTIYQGQMRYAWQKSTDNINWINVTNASYLVNPLAISENSSAFYRLTDTCLVSGQSAISNIIPVTTTSIFNCYCIPQATNCSGNSIDSVSFNTIHNSSGCSTGGYSDFTGISTSLNNGTNIGIYLKLKHAVSTTSYAGVWIDFNRNGSFESEERVFSGASATDMTGIINIPFNVKSGETLMRVAVSDASFIEPCVTGNRGETEDYKVILNTISPVNIKFCYYVNQSATGLNDGTNWANAFTSLATAFSYLHTGDTIKVAKGIYTPGNSNTNSFQLKDSVTVLGGFADTGNPANSDRNFSEYQSVMSGEIGLATNTTDNTKIILLATSAKDFIVDGFIIEDGYSNYADTDYGPVFLYAAAGTLKNVVIRKNYNYYKGSAINTLNSKLTLLNSFIENNENENTSGTASLFNITSKSDVAIINCVISKNKSALLLNQTNSKAKILNSTIFKNYGYSSVHDTSSLVVQNAIFYYNGNNYTTDSSEFKSDIYSSIAVRNTITEVYNSSGANNLGNNPKFIDTAKVAGADNKYFTNDDGLRLLNPCSPAINAGNNSFVATVPSDIAGYSRIKNGLADLGAYEVQEAISQQPAVLYVNKTATGLNNGTSWQNAFTDLQTSFYYCSDTIKVAKGNYPVSLTDPAASYRLSNHRVILGGYPNTGSPSNNDINTALNPVQIDGRINGTEKCQNIITSINNDSTCRMIGFEIMNSAAPEQFYPSDYATIKVSHKSSPYFENIKLNCLTNQANSLIEINDQSKPKFYKCTIYNGFISQNYDGGRTINITQNSAPSFTRCYFGKDTTATATTEIGASFLIDGAGGLIDSCVFYRARHNSIQNQHGSNPIIQNSAFTKCTGRNIENTAASPVIINCVFTDTAYYGNDFEGGSVANFNNSDVTFLKCRFYNSYSYRYGGACANENSNAVFKNCVFKNCSAGFDAGTLYNKTGRLKLINCLSYDSRTVLNVSYTQSQFLLNTENSVSEIINSTILTGTSSGNSIITSAGGTDTLKFYNSIAWRYGYNAQMINIGNDISTANNNDPAICDIRNSILFRQQNTPVTSTTTGIDPKLTDLSAIEGIDNILYTNDDGLKPCTCSPGINAGNNNLNQETKDISGLNRVYNSNIDIGAYEIQGNATSDKTFYVKENAAASGNGLSWAGAYNNLQKAVLNNCADTIKIAKGIYKPANLSRDSSFNIYKGTVMLGGFPDSGNPGNADRNVNANPTILSGDIGTTDDSTDNAYTVLKIHCPDTTVLLDGVIIERGNANTTENGTFNGYGGGIYAFGNKALTINNCIIRDNYASHGGGLYFNWSNMNVLKTVITNNNSERGGGFYTDDYYTTVAGNAWAPKVNFKNSVFSNNKGGAGTVSGTGVI